MSANGNGKEGEKVERIRPAAHIVPKGGMELERCRMQNAFLKQELDVRRDSDRLRVKVESGIVIACMMVACASAVAIAVRVWM